MPMHISIIHHEKQMYLNGPLGSVAILDVSITSQHNEANATQSPLNDATVLDAMCKRIIDMCRLHIVSQQQHQFEPYGITMLYLLSESHVSIHTWPENNCFSMDVHSCMSEVDTDAIKAAIEQALPVKKISCQLIKRGI